MTDVPDAGDEVFRGLSVRGGPATVAHLTCCNGVAWQIWWTDPQSNAGYFVMWKGGTTFAPPDLPLDPANAAFAQAFADIASNLVPLTTLPGSWIRVTDWPLVHDPETPIIIPPQFPADNRLFERRPASIYESTTGGPLLAFTASCRRPASTIDSGL